MHTMSSEEWHEPVTQRAYTGTLSTVGADGTPHITPV